MMVRCVRGEAKPIASVQDGLWSAALCLAAEESIKRNAPLSLKEFLEGSG
jgi:myo-inositol 2-dehydrogenase/D-chiro-inositol 1-dehydrogenase